MTFRTERAARIAGAAAAVLAVGVAACGGSGGSPAPGQSAAASSARAAVPGGIVRYALPPGVRPGYIWPYAPAGQAGEYNTQMFQMLMYRPLYTFGDNGSSVSVNYPLSVADAPRYSPDERTVSITLKGWRWSDGERVDAADVLFWLNLARAEPGGYYGYAPGLLPDNLASYAASGPDTVVLHLKSPASRIWFTYNQLAEITPMPAAWDVTASGAAPGSGGCATDTAADHWAKCGAVYDFLSAQARDRATYATSPLWRVVDGPWRLTSFRAGSSGPVASFAPNPAYSGAPRPRLAGLTYDAFASGATEYAALKSGRVDVGQVPEADLAPVPGGQVLPPASPLGAGYTLQPWYADRTEYFAVNLDNPAIGPAFRQLYVRQALQQLVDQPGMVAVVRRGYGYPTTGAVPSLPSSQWTPAIEYANDGQGPYPFSVTSATSLLSGHGWKPVGGTMTCSSPGASATECGTGIAAGTRLTFALDYPAGDPGARQEVAMLKSDMAQAGVQVSPVPRSPAAMSADARLCPSPSGCTWQALDSGGRSFNGPGYEPTGEPLYQTGGPANAGGYSSPLEDDLIKLTHVSDSLSVFQQYATYTAEQLPGVVYLPDRYDVMAVSARLANVAFSPLATTLPEYWYFTG